MNVPLKGHCQLMTEFDTLSTVPYQEQCQFSIKIFYYFRWRNF